MISIKRYLENILEEFNDYIKSDPKLCELKNVNFNAGNIPDYTDINIQQLYLLRYAYAYSFEYKSMYHSLFGRQRYENGISVVSIGCGTMIDYWSLVECMKEYGNNSYIKYRGIDTIDWQHKCDSRTIDDVKFIQKDASEIFSKVKCLNSDTYIFPKSISEFSSEKFDVLCNCFAEKQILKDTFYVLISLRSDEFSMNRDMDRTKKIIEAICQNGYNTRDEYNSYIHYKNKDKGIITYDHKFVYPDDAINLIKELNEHCKSYIDTGKNCLDECKRYLTRWPILKPTTIRFQILKFERTD